MNRHHSHAVPESPSPGSGLQLSESVGFLVNRVGRVMGARLSELLDPLGLTPSQWVMLHAIAAEPGLSQARLCQITGADAPTVSEVLRRLERRGIVERRRSAADGRRRELHLADPTAEALAAADFCAAEVNRTALQGFTGADTKRLFALLTRLLHNLEGP